MSALAQWNLDHVGMASSSELLVGKRHRRPSVRLGEIGDLPAAVLSKSSIKHRRLNPASMAASLTSISMSDTNPMVEKTFFPLICTGIVSEGDNSNVQMQKSSLHSSALNEEGVDPQQSIRAASKKVRNRNQKAPPSDMFGKTGPSTIKYREVHDSLSNQDEVCAIDRAFNTGTPEGFKDSNLETSDCTKGQKDGSNTHMPPYLYAGNVSPENRLEYYSLQPTMHLVIKQEHDDVERGHYRGTASNQDGHAISGQDMPYHSTDMPCCCHVSIGDKENRDRKSRGRTSKDSEQQSEKGVGLLLANLSSTDGVDGWLEALGLGKYASLFNFHEVDCDVLPLLTFGDLKEMGISAVGTRRKIFFAIQQLRKGHKGRLV